MVFEWQREVPMCNWAYRARVWHQYPDTGEPVIMEDLSNIGIGYAWIPLKN